MREAARAVRVHERGARARRDAQQLDRRGPTARVEARLAALDTRIVEINEQSELCDAAVGEAVALVDVATYVENTPDVPIWLRLMLAVAHAADWPRLN